MPSNTIKCFEIQEDEMFLQQDVVMFDEESLTTHETAGVVFPD